MTPLHASQLPGSLLEWGLLTSLELVSEGLEIAQHEGRNRTFHVRRPVRPGWFVKQASYPSGQRRLQREAEAHRYLQTHDKLRTWAGKHLPALHVHHSQQGVLVRDLVHPGHTLHEDFRQHGLRVESTRAQAELLADLHRLSQANGESSGQAFPSQPPWPLFLDDPAFEPFGKQAAPAVRTALKQLRKDSGLAIHAHKLRATWHAACLLHGDVKWSNFLWQGTGPKRRLQLVDWEMCQVGRPEWDAAGILHSFFALPVLFPQLAAYQAAHMRPHLALFWQVYAQGLGWTKGERDERARYARQLTGARMVQTAVEHAAKNEAQPALDRMAELTTLLLENASLDWDTLFLRAFPTQT